MTGPEHYLAAEALLARAAVAGEGYSVDHDDALRALLLAEAQAHATLAQAAATALCDGRSYANLPDGDEWRQAAGGASRSLADLPDLVEGRHVAPSGAAL